MAHIFPSPPANGYLVNDLLEFEDMSAIGKANDNSIHSRDLNEVGVGFVVVRVRLSHFRKVRKNWDGGKPDRLEVGVPCNAGNRSILFAGSGCPCLSEFRHFRLNKLLQRSAEREPHIDGPRLGEAGGETPATIYLNWWICRVGKDGSSQLERTTP